MKLKLSSILLITIALIIGVSMLISGFLLRKKYDKIDKTYKYWYYWELTKQPFRYIKIEQNSYEGDTMSMNTSISGFLRFEKGDFYKVLSSRSGYGTRASIEKGDTLNFKIINDTLLLRVPHFTTYYSNDKEISYDLVLTAPHLESITCLNVGTEITGLHQDSLYFDLSGRSYVEFRNDYANMNLIKANIKDRAVLELSPLLKLKRLDVVLKDRSKLKMPIVPAETFTIDAGDSTAIEGPSKFFKKESDK